MLNGLPNDWLPKLPAILVLPLKPAMLPSPTVVTGCGMLMPLPLPRLLPALPTPPPGGNRGAHALLHVGPADESYDHI